MTTNTSRRIAVLERSAKVDAGPLVLFGTPTAEQQQAAALAAREGRRVIFWPVALPRIESVLAERKQP